MCIVKRKTLTRKWLPENYVARHNYLQRHCFFPEEGKTGITPTLLILEKRAAAVGVDVTINWQGEHVPAKIVALSGKYRCNNCVNFL